MNTEQAITEIWAMFRETSRKFEETDRKFQETDRRFRETDRKFRQTDRKIDEVSTSVGRLGNRMGEFVEGMVKPAVVRLFQARGIAVHEVHRDLSGQRDGESAQVDLLVVNDGVCVVVEVKSRLGVDDVNEHRDRMNKFKRVFPLYRDIQAHGAVAAMVIPDNVARYAYRQGFYVIGQKGETAEILNDVQFQPVTW